LTVLSLNGNNLRSAGVIKLAKTLQHISSLDILYIKENKITAKVADYLAVVLP